MSTRERPRSSSSEYDALNDDITDADVEAYLQEQAVEEEEEREKEKKPGFFNLQTGSGLALIGVGLVYLLQLLGFPLGFPLVALVQMLPWLAGILIILTGFGVLSWSPARRRRRARAEALRRAAQRQREQAARRAASGRTMGRGVDPESARKLADAALRQAEVLGTKAFDQARRAFDRAERSTSRAQSGARSRSRRLARSVKDKKMMGVCAGIARYLGIDPIIVRLLFVVSVFPSSGATIPLYFILGAVMPKADDEDGVDDDPLIRVTTD